MDGSGGTEGRVIACSRIGCDAPAAASFSFDAISELAWLDTVVEARGAGFLCELHAERLTPPRGWSLLDRRSPEPKLFVAKPTTKETRAAKERPKRARSSRARHPEVPASEVATGSGELPFDAPPPEPRTWSPRDLPDLDEVADDRTPLLARAFESLRQHEERAGDHPPDDHPPDEPLIF